MGTAFQAMLNPWGIEAHPISVQNPQANAVCERMDQTVGNLLYVHCCTLSLLPIFNRRPLILLIQLWIRRCMHYNLLFIVGIEVKVVIQH
jgi:hypothetical protein